MCEAIWAVQASRCNLKVDFFCYLRQTVLISTRENGCQSITRQNVAHSSFGYTGLINDRFRSAPTVPRLAWMHAFRGIRPREDAVVIIGPGRADPGIVPASPSVPFDLKGFCLVGTVQHFRIRCNDRRDDRVIGVHDHTDFGQTVCNLAPKLVMDGRQIDSADVD